MDLIFFERQQAALCAQHALNMLLQGDYFSASDLAEIARRLDQEENVVLDPHSRNSKSVNMDDHGYFSVQVLSEALKAFSLDLISITHPSVAEIRKDPLKAKAFICNQSEHWFTLRKFGNQWFLLNSMKNGPQLISDTYMDMYLHQLKDEGYSIFVVRGVLPNSEADQVIAMCPVQQQIPPPKQTKAGVMSGIGRRLGSIVEDLSNKVLGGPSDHESDMEKAIRLSLADDPNTATNFEDDEEELLRKAIQLSKQESDPNETPILIPSTSGSSSTEDLDSDMNLATMKSLDPAQNVQVRNIPIQLIDSKSDPQSLRAKREGFLNNFK